MAETFIARWRERRRPVAQAVRRELRHARRTIDSGTKLLYESGEIRERLVALGQPALPYLHAALEGRASYVELLLLDVLGRIGDETTVEVLAELQVPGRSENVVAFHALEALAHLDGPRTIALAEKHLSSDGTLRAPAAAAIGRIPSGPAARDAAALAARYLDDSDDEVRAAVCESLGRLGVREHAERLGAFTSGDNRRVAAGAALALVRLDAADRLARIWPRLSVERQRAVMSRIAMAEAEAHPKAMPLLEVAVTSADEAILADAARALGSHPDERAGEMILGLFRDGQGSNLTEEGVAALLWRQESWRLVSRWDDLPLRLRLEIVASLKLLGRTEELLAGVVEVLKRALVDENLSVAGLAAEASIELDLSELMSRIERVIELLRAREAQSAAGE